MKKDNFKHENQKRNVTLECFLLIVVIVLSGALITSMVKKIDSVIKDSKSSESRLEDGYITRTFDELLAVLDEAPEDITKVPYKENIPSMIQQDIDYMMNSKEVLIRYHDKLNKSEIIIAKDFDNEPVWEFYTQNFAYISNKYTNNISIYKNGDDILVYGSSGGRDIDCVELKANGEVNSLFPQLSETTVDLLGTPKEEYDDIRNCGCEMTLVRKGKELSFYRLGEKVGETVFPGGKIKKFNYMYVLDENDDLYYFYYSSNPQKPWMKFIKVDSVRMNTKEDEYVERKINTKIGEEEYSRSIKYPIYIKDGKRYATYLSDEKTEIAYGQNYGVGNDTETFNPNFSLETVELSENFLQKVQIKATSVDFTEASYNWYMEYSFGKVYISKRIDGLDQEISKRISESEKKQFDGKEIAPSDVKETIKKLKEMYAKYEENEF